MKITLDQIARAEARLPGYMRQRKEYGLAEFKFEDGW